MELERFGPLERSRGSVGAMSGRRDPSERLESLPMSLRRPRSSGEGGSGRGLPAPLSGLRGGWGLGLRLALGRERSPLMKELRGAPNTRLPGRELARMPPQDGLALAPARSSRVAGFFAPCEAAQLACPQLQDMSPIDAPEAHDSLQ